MADSSTYGSFAPPSWEAPAEYLEKCYWGDLQACLLLEKREHFFVIICFLNCDPFNRLEPKRQN